MVLHYHVGFRTCVHKSLLRMHTVRRFQLSSTGKGEKTGKKTAKVWLWVLISWKTTMLWAGSSPGENAELSAQQEKQQEWGWPRGRALLSKRNKNQPSRVTLYRKVNETYWLIYFTHTGRSGTPLRDGWVWITPGKQEGQGPVWQAQTGYAGTREQNSNRMGLSLLHRIPHPTQVPEDRWPGQHEL